VYASKIGENDQLITAFLCLFMAKPYPCLFILLMSQLMLKLGNK